MKKNFKLKLFGIIFTMVLLLLALSGATYAWFTHNRVADTSIVTAQTGEDTVELYVSSSADSFTLTKEAEIVQVNAANKEKLMPVSTSDLKTFIYSPSSTGNVVSQFAQDTDGKYYYHGRIYLEAVITGDNAGKSLNLYLDTSDTSGGSLVSNTTDEVLNASRLGLTFDSADTVIMYLSKNSNVGDEAYKTTTVVNGTEVGEGNVLTMNGGSVTAVADPAVYIDDYTITINDGSVKVPEKPLITMTSNKIYTVDIYFYFEGCDPDCDSAISLDDLNLHLGFYGVLQ